MRDSAPVITVQMHDVTVKIGEPATFDVQISGQPRPDVYWTKVRVQLLLFLSCIPYTCIMMVYLNRLGNCFWIPGLNGCFTCDVGWQASVREQAMEVHR